MIAILQHISFRRVLAGSGHVYCASNKCQNVCCALSRYVGESEETQISNSNSGEDNGKEYWNELILSLLDPSKCLSVFGSFIFVKHDKMAEDPPWFPMSMIQDL